MEYAAQVAVQLNTARADVSRELRNLWLSLASEVSPKLKKPNAQAFLLQGVCRRLKCIQRCMDSIFEVFPVDRHELLTDEELSDIEIHLHSFLIHCHGMADNLAWTYILERTITLNRQDVGLFLKETQKVLPPEVRDYLTTERLKAWHIKYAKNYRDAQAHRIPPYLPPFVQTPEHEQRSKEREAKIAEAIREGDLDRALELSGEERTEGSICLAVADSFSGEDRGEPVLPHAQLMVDARTVMEITKKIGPHLAVD
ncbi:MAG: hypothetical protein AB7G48_11510 [Nitrospiraceae bacterium]